MPSNFLWRYLQELGQQINAGCLLRAYERGHLAPNNLVGFFRGAVPPPMLVGQDS